MHPGQHPDINIDSKTRLHILISAPPSNMANRMNLDFMMNGQQEVVTPTRVTEDLRQLVIRPQHRDTRMEYDVRSPDTPSSSSSSYSHSEGGSRFPSVERTMAPLRMEGLRSDESNSNSNTSLPPLRYLNLSPQQTERPRPFCENPSHQFHTCQNCWSLGESFGRTWTCCQCHYHQRALEDYQHSFEISESNGSIPLAPRGADIRQSSHSPLSRHDLYGRRASYSDSQHHRSHPRESLLRGRRKSKTDKIGKAPHSNKKYPRIQVLWIRYMKEDCGTKFDTMAKELWEKKWPGCRPSISDQSVSSRYYRDNVHPLLDDMEQLMYVDGRVIMRTVKVRERTTQHKGIPYTFVEMLPHKALEYDWVSPEHKEQARKIIAEDEQFPNTKAAICRRALLEVENSHDQPSSTSTSSCSSTTTPTRRKATEQTGFVILVENKLAESACRCSKKKCKSRSGADTEDGPARDMIHPPYCPASNHPALRMCDCPVEIRRQTSLHLPACESLKFGLRKRS